VTFASDTDSECAAHLLSEELSALLSADYLSDQAGSQLDPVPADAAGQLAWAMRRVCRQLEGAFTLLAVDRQAPGVVVGARRNSPLVVGRGEGENFLASDVSAFIDYTREAIELGQDQVVTITPAGVTITDFQGRPESGRPFHVDWDAAAAEKGGYDYFMLKEIAEQPRAIAETLLGRLDEEGDVSLSDLALTDDQLRDLNKVFIVACGTAYHAGLVTKYAIENWTRVPCEVDLSSEFRYRDPVLDEHTLVIAISQSGETMDTLMAIRHAKRQGAKVLAICNTSGSTIPRESDGVLYTRGGPEIAVASTKAFLTQLVVGYLFSLRLARVRQTMPVAARLETAAQLLAMSGKVEQVLGRLDPLRELARELSAGSRILFIGRHVGFPVALEAALKLKEISYMHAEGFGAGELKHGSIALIDEGTPVVCMVPSSRTVPVLHEKMISNIQEVRARGARTIVLGEEGDEGLRRYADHLFLLPEAPTMLFPLLATPPLQVLAAEVSIARGYDVDQPRNLAKSVTVE
jgi:glutamine---fructose-6-phosphate transaminase (isomerizing)